MSIAKLMQDTCRPATFADPASVISSVTDNGGETCDRYTVWFCDGTYLGLSSNPASPHGFSQWGEGEKPEGFQDQEIPWESLPPEIQQHVYDRWSYNP